MPRIQKAYTLDISPEQFLNNCSGTELQEIALLINTAKYQSKMREGVSFYEAKENIMNLGEEKLKKTVPQCRVCKSSDTDNKRFISKTLCEECWEKAIAE